MDKIDDITGLFTRSDGSYLCARWGRPVAPVVFGLADQTLDIFRAAIRAGFAHARHPVIDIDPETGSNLMLFFVPDWDDLSGVPDLDRLTGVSDLPARLSAAGAEHYRLFRFDPEGGIRVCFGFMRMSGALADAHPAALAEAVVMRSALSFASEVTPTPWLARVIRAAYDPVLPVAAHDPAHALRLAARMGQDTP